MVALEPIPFLTKSGCKNAGELESHILMNIQMI